MLKTILLLHVEQHSPLLIGMKNVYRLSYDSNVKPLADELVKAAPTGAWNIIKTHFENHFQNGAVIYSVG